MDDNIEEFAIPQPKQATKQDNKKLEKAATPAKAQKLEKEKKEPIKEK